jgi:hypothetical protein
MTLYFVTRVPKRLVRANQRYSKDVLVSLRIKAPIAAQRIGGDGCDNEVYRLRKACFIDCGSFAHGHPPGKMIGAYRDGRGNAAISSRVRTDSTC